MELEILQEAEISGTRLLSLTLACTAFVNSAYPENWALLYEPLSMLATKKTGVLKETVLLFQPSTKSY